MRGRKIETDRCFAQRKTIPHKADPYGLWVAHFRKRYWHCQPNQNKTKYINKFGNIGQWKRVILFYPQFLIHSRSNRGQRSKFKFFFCLCFSKSAPFFAWDYDVGKWAPDSEEVFDFHHFYKKKQDFLRCWQVVIRVSRMCLNVKPISSECCSENFERLKSMWTHHAPKEIRNNKSTYKFEMP